MRSLALHLLFDLLVPALFGAAVYVMEVSDWDRGIARNVAFAAVTVVVIALYAWRRRSVPASPPRAWIAVLCVAAGLLLGWRSVQSWENLGAVPLDIAFSTLDSIKAIVKEHKDPYANPIDSRKEAPKEARGFRYYHGYKYLPAMLIVYAPLAVKWEFPGIMLTNWLLFLAVGLLVYLLAARGTADRRLETGDCREHPSAGRDVNGFGLQPAAYSLQPVARGLNASGLRGLILYLSLGMISLEMFEKGVNDFAQMVPLLLGFYALSQRRMALAGAAIGFSLGAKLLPGVIIAAMFLPLAWNRRFVVAAAVTALALYVPFLLWHPREFIANTILFALDRVPNTSSVMYYLPAAWQKPWLWAGRAITLAIFAAWFLKKGKDWRGLMVFGAAIVTVFLGFGPMVHRNYLLWVIPFYCVIIPGVAYPAKQQ